MDGPSFPRRTNRISSPLQNKLAFENERAEGILGTWCILIGFEHTPWTIRVDFVEFSSDRNVGQADALWNPL